MIKILNMSWIVGIGLWFLNFFRIFFHKPLNRCVKYYKHTLLDKNIISHKQIKIELVKKENLGLNKKVTITDIKFCLNGVDRHGNEFAQDYQIDWIDKKYMSFKENDDIQEYTIKIPQKICFDYFDAKELKLSIGYHSPLNTDFLFSQEQIDLKSEILQPFKNFVEKARTIITSVDEIDKNDKIKEVNQKQIKESNSFWTQRDNDNLTDDEYFEGLK